MTPLELFHGNTNLVYSMISKNSFTLPDYDYEDFVQLGLLGLWLVANTYRPDLKNVKFSTYAFTCIRNEMYREIMDRKRKLKLNVPTLSLSEVSLPYAHDIVEEAINRILVEESLALMPPIGAQIMKEIYVQGKNTIDIAEEFNIPHNEIRNWKHRCKAAVKKKIKLDAF